MKAEKVCMPHNDNDWVLFSIKGCPLEGPRVSGAMMSC